MLDTLLGRASLKETIAELEEELEACRDTRGRLEAQLESAESSRKSAVRDHQQAQERVNTLEDRVEQLEDALERARAESDVSVRGRRTLGRTGMRRLLAVLDGISIDNEGAYTAMLDSDGGPNDVLADRLGERAGLVERLRPCLCLVDSFGVVELAFEPPIAPDPFDRHDSRFHLEDGWFLPTEAYTFALVRSDLFAIGAISGGTIEYVDGFTSDVMGRHSKGGFSQARFERRREEQIDQHLERSRSRLRTYADDDDRLILTGAQAMLDRLDISAVARSPVDASGAPEEALAAAFDEFWQTTVHRL